MISSELKEVVERLDRLVDEEGNDRVAQLIDRDHELKIEIKKHHQGFYEKVYSTPILTENDTYQELVEDSVE